MAQARAPRRGEPSTFCRAPEALTLFALTVQHVLRAQRLAGEWPVFQVPCESLSSLADVGPRALLVVDRSFASDQDVLSYGFTPLPVLPAADTAPRPNDPFARIGRWILQPSLAAVPSVWTRGAVEPSRLEVMRLAMAAGAVQALAGLSDTLCSSNRSAVPDQLLASAEQLTRNHPDYHLYFEAALREHQVMLGQSRPLSSLVAAVAQDLRGAVVPHLRCDVGNRDRFSLTPFGPGLTTLTKAAEHIQGALDGLRSEGRSDLAQLNLARTCVLEAVADMQRTSRPPSCQAVDYGLWTRAYAPLLHAAQVKVLQTSR